MAEGVVTSDVARGYNIYMGNTRPVFTAIDPGFTRHLFQFKVSQATSGRVFVNGYQMFDYTTCDLEFVSKKFHSFQEYQKTTVTKSKKGIDAFLANYKTSTETKRVKKRMTETNEVIITKILSSSSSSSTSSPPWSSSPPSTPPPEPPPPKPPPFQFKLFRF